MLDIKKRTFLILIICIFCPNAYSNAASTAKGSGKIITFLGPGIYQGTTYSFLKLGLEKANINNGSFELRQARDMNRARALVSLKNKRFPNAIRRFEPRKEIMEDKDLIPVRFPVYLGSYGYRLCYVNERNVQKFQQANLSALKSFTFGMVKGWKDIEILQFNDFKTSQNISVSGLYKQLSVGRVDTVCRAAIEIDYEREQVARIKGITLDSSKLIVYNMPFFFFTHKDDKALAEKLELGLIKAYKDGSYHRLWKTLYEESLEEFDLKSREIVRLKSPIDRHIPFQYQQFMPHFMGEKPESTKVEGKTPTASTSPNNTP